MIIFVVQIINKHSLLNSKDYASKDYFIGRHLPKFIEST